MNIAALLAFVPKTDSQELRRHFFATTTTSDEEHFNAMAQFETKAMSNSIEWEHRRRKRADDV